MTNGEISAISIANQHKGNLTQIEKLKKLGEEFTEFIEAVLIKEDKDILDEAGDMCFLILHILHKQGIPNDKINLTNLIVNASDKMEMRHTNQTPRKE